MHELIWANYLSNNTISANDHCEQLSHAKLGVDLNILFFRKWVQIGKQDTKEAITPDGSGKKPAVV